MSSSAPRPAPPTPRIRTMDIARGFAVMGILLMNVIAFSMPEAAYLNPDAWGGRGGADRLTWALSFILFDGKMRGLFSLLFGASMLLLMDRTEMSGGDGRVRHIVRSFWLLLIGALHYLLIWWGDILSLYAVVGLIALLLAGKTPMQLVKFAFLAFFAEFVLLALKMLGIYRALSLTGTDPERIGRMLDSMGRPESGAILQEIALYRGGWIETVAHKAADYVHWSVNGLEYMTLDTLGFMLLGMAMLKGGFLTGAWQREQYLATARHCFVIAVPPMTALAIWCWASGFDTVTTFGAVFAWSFPFRIPLTVGWAALILAVATRGKPGAFLTRVEAVGRMSLSNYLGTSIVMTAIFYGWGIGLFARVPRSEVYLFILPVWALMLSWSRLWLDRFVQGPLEWVWRTLTVGRPQPLLRRLGSVAAQTEQR
ncbi:MAG: DUF418 domain-containing protein [Sphingobium sp.]